MFKSTTKRKAKPVVQQVDLEVHAFRRQFEDKSPLDELVRERARRRIDLSSSVDDSHTARAISSSSS